jgi:hypothetical protein
MWAGFLAPVHRTKVPGSSLPHCWGPPHTKRPTGCSCRRATAGALRRACAPQVHPAPNPASEGALKSSNICCIHAKRLQLTVATPWNWPPRTAAPRSIALWRPIRWPHACGRLWPRAIRGSVPLPICCGRVPRAALVNCRGEKRVSKNPPALAGRLRRAQTFLRILGIDVAFSREGRAGSRTIRIRTTVEIPSASTATSATPEPSV